MTHKIFAKHIFVLLTFCLANILATSARTLRVTDNADNAEQLVKRFFANGDLPFSFSIDGRSSDTFIKQWKRQLSKPTTDGEGGLHYTLTLTSPKSVGLQLTADIVAYTDFPAMEWTLHFTNISNTPSPRISDVNAADVTLAGNTAYDKYTLYTAQGCNAIDRDFHLLRIPLKADSTYRYKPTGGRPSSLTGFPFYNIASTADAGVMFSIGWSGTWFAHFESDKGGQLGVKSGMADVNLFLHPGESIRTPLVSFLFWKGDDRLIGNNSFRRFVLAHHSPKVDGKSIVPPLCSGFDYGDPAPCSEYEALTELLAAAAVDRHSRFGIIPDVFWLDAGWYEGCNAPQSAYEGRSWYTTVGNWVADPNRFPNGLKPMADEVHKTGAQFMVWFEPERVYEGSRWYKDHNEWLLSDKDNKSFLLNIGNPDACDFLCKYMGDFFEQNGIDHYRQDFNINPAAYWAAADSVGRQGITEIRYVEGLYRFWDYLHERFPSMIIDNCASGGRRFDLETISRSIPLWRTDCHYGEPTCQQCHNYGLNQFLPLHGTGIYYADRYCSRSGLSSAYAWFGEIFSRQNSIDDLRHTFETYRNLREYFLADFYPLSGDDDMTGSDRWIAWQFHDTAKNCGVIQAFRRDNSKEPSKVYSLHGLDPETIYDVYNEDNKITVQRTGRELMTALLLTLPTARTSLLLTYSPVKK